MALTHHYNKCALIGVTFFSVVFQSGGGWKTAVFAFHENMLNGSFPEPNLNVRVRQREVEGFLNWLEKLGQGVVCDC